MQLRPIYEHHILSEGDLWPTIRSEVIKLLNQRNIQHSSVDLVRFSWAKEDNKNEDDEKNDDDEDDGGDGNVSDIEDSDIKLSPYGTVVTTPITIRERVLPDTLTGEVAFKSSNDILDLLKEHGISDVDVAYRESVAKSSSGPELFTSVSDLDPRRPLSIP
ncbi:hypothetical protein HETIRDRAFT_311461 [Heterobasidion irregulare TC 32-1]|uniref:Uncharacterized protein n=1 Tax=Heterobasidion irregulare (strain TC 32-1) TaxID=747525 RepID=W4KJA7_HETIT|nr:uncharacterized protein HETIRDRAFT_311461 [Heterobasidion irregulare TC 32-1]ETW85937.1 hypothetical protein HETIRDRAFT_311461 [Heterobasidion irregulare TC 32-1]